VLRIIFGPKLDKVTWDRRMHNTELYVYSSPVTIWVTKSRMRWVGHMGERTGVYGVLVGKNVENLGIGGLNYKVCSKKTHLLL
jgi:hypothetical protein